MSLINRTDFYVCHRLFSSHIGHIEVSCPLTLTAVGHFEAITAASAEIENNRGEPPVFRTRHHLSQTDAMQTEPYNPHEGRLYCCITLHTVYLV